MINLLEKKTALVIVDIQNDYFSNGLNPLKDADLALEKAKDLLNAFREKSQPVIHVRHISLRENAPFFLPDTKGSEIHSHISPVQDEHIVIKHKADSFIDTDLNSILKQHEVERIVLCGMMSHHCIDTTVRSGSNAYEILLVHDACATKDLSFNGEVIPAELVHKTFMAALQGFARVMSTAEILEKV